MLTKKLRTFHANRVIREHLDLQLREHPGYGQKIIQEEDGETASCHIG